MKNKLSAKLQEVLDRGFIPQEVKKYMGANGHDGQVWIVEQKDDRIGIGYGVEAGDKHVLIYDLPEIEAILKEVS